MRLCQNHWNTVLQRVSNGLAANILIMQKLLQAVPSQDFYGDIYRLQEAIGDGCPICFLETEYGKGEDLLESVLEEMENEERSG